MRVAFLGFGLIGGSVARALREPTRRSDWSIAAWSPSGDGPALGVADGVIDVAAATVADAVRGADMVVLAAPVPACLTLLDELAGGAARDLATNAVITDVASTKAVLLDRANALGLRYVGGHPMAGLESAGFGAGRGDLFVGRPWVVVAGRFADAGDSERVEALARACGAHAIPMAADAHDRAVAGISHLPLVLAAALVEAVALSDIAEHRADWPGAVALAASGWRDTTRLARGDPQMGAGIVATNAAALASRLRELRAVLDRWQAELDRPGGPDADAIEDWLRAVSSALDVP